MKLYIKKTAIVFLIISFVLSSINISAFKTYSKEINETDIIAEETESLYSENSDESEVDKLENEGF